jgi:cytochrome c-type biogenesis protein CcmH
MFWTSIGFLTLLVVAIIAIPLARRGTRATAPATQSIPVYREQLAALDRDLAHGLLTEEQVAAARAEIEPRILAATRAAKESLSGIGAGGRRLAVAVIALGLPAGAISLYLYLGMPNMPDRPLAQRTEEVKRMAQLRQLDAYARKLTVRLQERPDDAEAWGLLGRLYNMLGRIRESADAYGRAHALRPAAADAAADHGEALVHLAKGRVPDAAEAMFVAAIKIDPKHAKARFYLGSALAQRPQELPQAIAVWSSLEKEAPPDAPWLDALRQNLRVAEADLAGLTAAQPEIGPDADLPGTRVNVGADE